MLKSSKKIFFFKFLIYVNFMLIYVKIIKKKKTFYGRTTQNYSSEPHKTLKIF